VEATDSQLGIERWLSVSVIMSRRVIVLCNIFTPTRKALDFKHTSQ